MATLPIVGARRLLVVDVQEAGLDQFGPTDGDDHVAACRLSGGPGAFDDGSEMPSCLWLAVKPGRFGECWRWADSHRILRRAEENGELGDMRFTLRNDVRSVREARLKVRAIGDLPEHVLTDAELVVSELVANSLRHACLDDRDVIEVALERDDARLTIVVDDHDGFSGIPGAHRPARRSGGMGLKLLDAICEHWYAESGRVVASLTI